MRNKNESDCKLLKNSNNKKMENVIKDVNMKLLQGTKLCYIFTNPKNLGIKKWLTKKVNDQRLHVVCAFFFNLKV